jgi:DNA-binding NarL/FixJ family response regulator
VTVETVVVLGRVGLTRDILTHLFATAGYDILDLAALERDPDRTVIVILVDPNPEDWASLPEDARAVAIVSDARRAEVVIDVVLRGADAVLDANDDFPSIFAAVEALLNDEAVLRPAQAKLVLGRLRELSRESVSPLRLTTREMQILDSIERGEVVKQTARSLGIAEKTVQNLQSRLFRKLRARNRAQAVSRAHELGILGRLTAVRDAGRGDEDRAS